MDSQKTSKTISPRKPIKDRSGYVLHQVHKENLISEHSISNDQEISGKTSGKIKTKEMGLHSVSDMGAGDTSVTDDDIEVICRYSAPQIDKFQADDLEKTAHDDQQPSDREKESPKHQTIEPVAHQNDMMSMNQHNPASQIDLGLQDPAILHQHHEPPPPPHPFFNPAYASPVIFAPFMMTNQGGTPQQVHDNFEARTPIKDADGNILQNGTGHDSILPQPFQVPPPYNMPIASMNSPFCYGDIPYNTRPSAPGQNPVINEQPNLCGPIPEQYVQQAENHPSGPASTEVYFPYPFDPIGPHALSLTQSDHHMSPGLSQNNGYSNMMDLQRPDEMQQPQAFVYPSIYVSSTGMITVLMKHDVSVEMTVDRTVRLVSHNRNMAVAANSRGTSSVMHHYSAKVSQDNTTTEVELEDFQAKMTTDNITFGFGTNCYKFDYKNIELTTSKFTDLSMDKSVDVLFASEGFGSTLVPQCLHLVGVAEYENLPKGGVIVRINGVKITQTGKGDVTVVTGPKILKVSPTFGSMRIMTHFMEMSIDKDEVLRLRRGNHILDTSNGHIVISNCKIEAMLENRKRLRVYMLPKRIPLELPREHKPRPGNPRRKQATNTNNDHRGQR